MPAFALGAGESQRLVDALLDGADGSAPSSVHLAGPDDDAALLSLQVAADVFLDSFGNTASLLRDEYAPLLPSMTHLLVLDRSRRTAVGSLILQEAPAGELKTFADLARPPWSLPADGALTAVDLVPGARTAADLLLLAVSPTHRNRGLAPLLMYAGWVASVQHGIDRWTAILDDSLLRGLHGLTGGAVRPIASSHPYLGSPASTPVTVRMNPALDLPLLGRMQRVGAIAASRVSFCPRLAPAVETFQALRPPSSARLRPGTPRVREAALSG
jgi:ribosomal protein S18 acetylase RimI-like enzyme